MEPNISDSSNGSVWAWPPQPDEPVLKQFMEVAMAEHDRYLASERPWSSSARTSMPEGRIRFDTTSTNPDSGADSALSQ